MRKFNHLKISLLTVTILTVNCLAVGGGASSLQSEQGAGFSPLVFFMNMVSGGAANADTGLQTNADAGVQSDGTAQAEVSERLIDSNGNPIVGATVEASLESSLSRSRLVTRSVTDSTGRFTLRLRFGRHLLRVRSATGVDLGTLTLEVMSLQSTPTVTNVTGSFSVSSITVSQIAVEPTPTATTAPNTQTSSTSTEPPAIPPSLAFISRSSDYVTAQIGGKTSVGLKFNSDQPGSYTFRKSSSSCSSGTSIANGNLSSGGNLDFNVAANLLEIGTHEYRLCLTSSKNATNDITIQLSRDDTSPIVTANPAGSLTGIAPSVTLSCSDSGGAGVGEIAYTTNGSSPSLNQITGSVTSGSLFSSSITPATNATTVLKFICRDLAGNLSALVSETYTIDSILPTVTIANASPTTIGPTGNISLTWSGNKSGNYQIKIGGSASNCSDGTASSGSNPNGSFTSGSITSTIPSSQLVNGNNTIRVCLTDALANVGISSSIITKDTISPTIVSTTPQNNSTSIDTNLNSVSIAFNKDMNSSTLASKLSFSPSGRTATFSSYDNATRTANYSLSGGDFSYDTQYTMLIASGIQDTLGNSLGSVTSSSFRTKTFAQSNDPTVSLLSQNYNFVSGVVGAIGNFIVRINSNQSGSYQIRRGSSSCSDGSQIASGSITAGETEYTIQASSLGIGSNTLRFCVTNPVSRVGFSTFFITRDDSLPSVSISPGGGTYGSARSVTLTCSDSGSSGVRRLAYTTNGSNPEIDRITGTVITGLAYSTAISLATQGTTTFKGLCLDNAGNLSNINTQTITIDFVPTVTISSTSPTLVGNSGNVTVQWSASESGNYQVKIGGSASNCSDGTVSTGVNATGSYSASFITSTIPVTQLGSGANTLRICLTDNNGNVAIATTSVSRDMTPPSIVSISPANGANRIERYNATISITFSESVDPQSLIDKVTFVPLGRIATFSGYDNSLKRATYNLTGNTFDENTVYTIQILGGIADLFGNLTIIQNVSSFRTRPTEWQIESYIKAPNAEIDDNFGSALAISENTIIVGVRFEDSNQTTITNGSTASGNNSALESGAAYIFVRSGSNWVQQAYIKAPNSESGDAFGFSVAINGDTIVVGARQEDSNQTTVTNGTIASSNNTIASSGAAYVFVRSGTTWSQQAFLKASNANPEDLFGSRVSISGDNLAIGAPFEDSNQSTISNGSIASSDNSFTESGAVYLFSRNGSTWSQRAYLKAPNLWGSTIFGTSLSIDSNTLVVGAPRDSAAVTEIIHGPTTVYSGSLFSGAAYVFVLSNNIWNLQAILKAPNVGESDNFGSAISISGDTIAVGAPGEDSNQMTITNSSTASWDNSVSDSGAAYVFNRSNNFWSMQAYLKAENAGSNDSFGSSVAIFQDRLVVGAPGEDSNIQFTNGITSSLDNSFSSSGAAYVFHRFSNLWRNQSYLKATNAESNDSFGSTVAIFQDRLVVGAPGEDSNHTTISNGSIVNSNNSASNSGAVYVYAWQ